MAWFLLYILAAGLALRAKEDEFYHHYPMGSVFACLLVGWLLVPIIILRRLI